MADTLSVSAKQTLSTNSEAELKWEDLDSKDRKIIIAVTFTDSVEDARRSMGLSVSGFYKRWKYLKPVYSRLLNDFPSHAIDVLKASSKQAATVLTESLEALNPADRIKAANSILDRVTPEREQVQKGAYRKITLEEFIGLDDPDGSGRDVSFGASQQD